MTPTPEDMARDLAADLGEYARLSREVPEWVGGTMRESDVAVLCHASLPAAIRRALAAEAEVERLRRLVAGLSDRVAAQSDLLTGRAERRET